MASFLEQFEDAVVEDREAKRDRDTKRERALAADPSELTPHGFTWGPAKIERVTTIREGEKIRGRVLGIETEKSRVELWITPKGEIRVIRNQRLGYIGAPPKDPPR